MPKLKPTERELLDRSTRAVISSAKEINAVSDKEIARAIAKTVRTLQNKIKSPGTLTLDELRTIKKVLKLSDADVIRMVG